MLFFYTKNIKKESTQKCRFANHLSGGQGWIRTIVGVSQQIYSLPPLATRAPTQRFKWWAFRDSNPGPFGYEPSALTN